MPAGPARPSRFSTVSIRRYLTLIVLTALLPAGVLAGVLLYGFWNDQSERIQAELLARSRTLASLVQTELDGTVARLRILASNPLLDAGRERDFHARLARVLADNDDWCELRLVSRERPLLDAALAFEAPSSRPDLLRIERAAMASGTVVVGDWQAPPPGRPQTVLITVPVIRDGVATHALTVGLDALALSAKLRALVPADSVVALLDRDGHFLARSRDPETFIGGKIGPLLRAALAESDGRVIRSFTREGEATFTGFARLADGLAVGVAMPSAAFDRVLVRSLLILAGIVVAALVLGLLLSQWLLSRIDRQIAQTVENASRLVAGEEVPAAASSVRELATISDAVRRLFLRERDAREKERAASRAKDDFLAMLGHELRNPLAPIVTALQLMRLRGGDVLQKERDIIERQVRHLQRLVDDLLDVARIARGSLTLRRERVNVASVVGDAIEIAEPVLSARRIRIRADLPSTGLVVDGDPARLCQVVGNLLTNAAKFSAEGTLIVVDAAQVAGQVELRVVDTGAGLADADRERIFEPFTQAAQSVDRPEGGLGLGLAIARSIARLHDGDLVAESAGPGRGSTFRLTLPVHAAASDAAPAAVPVPPTALADNGDGPRVMIVDDNVDAAQTLAELLRLHGYRTEVLHDGRAALDALRIDIPDVMLLDIGLPGLDGYEVATRIRREAAWSRMRLIAVTGYGQAGDIERGRRAGFDAHLVKPVEGDLLVQAIGIPARG